jgi:hypothetical protein
MKNVFSLKQRAVDMKKKFVVFINLVWSVRKTVKTGYLASLCLSSVRPSVGPSFRVEQIDCHWTDFHEIYHLNVIRKLVEKIQISLKSDKNNGSFT